MKKKKFKPKLKGIAKRIAIAEKNMKKEDDAISKWKNSLPKFNSLPIWEYKKTK